MKNRTRKAVEMKETEKKLRTLVEVIFDAPHELGKVFSETEESWFAQRVPCFELETLWKTECANMSANIDRVPRFQSEFDAQLDVLFAETDSIADKASALQNLMAGAAEITGPKDMATIEHFRNMKFN